MARLLYLVHGMGRPAEGWADVLTGILRDRAAAFGIADRFDADVVVQPVSWASPIERLLETWDRSADQVARAGNDAGRDVASTVDWLSGVSSDEAGFFWSHAVDALLYGAFPQVANEVRARALESIVTPLEAMMRGGNRVPAVIVAHGLGTAVAHDALALMGSRPIGSSLAFMAGNFRFDSVFMLSNVSRTLQRDLDPYTSVVHPLSVRSADAYTGLYWNIRHALDPLPLVRRFEPEGWGSRYRPVEDLDHVLDFDIHSFEHYLRHPAVHVPILNRLLDGAIGEDARASAEAELADLPGPPCLDELRSLLEQLDAMRLRLATHSDGLAIVREAAMLYLRIREARDACG